MFPFFLQLQHTKSTIKMDIVYFYRYHVKGTCDYLINNVNMANRIETKTYHFP